jgi:hypothetical protein
MDPLLAVSTPENLQNLWGLVTGPYTGVFPTAAVFWAIVLAAVELGLWMKTQSAGAVAASLVVMSALLAGLVRPFGWVFGIVCGVALAFLMYRMVRSRGW